MERASVEERSKRLISTVKRWIECWLKCGWSGWNQPHGWKDFNRAVEKVSTNHSGWLIKFQLHFNRGWIQPFQPHFNRGLNCLTIKTAAKGISRLMMSLWLAGDFHNLIIGRWRQEECTLYSNCNQVCWNKPIIAFHAPSKTASNWCNYTDVFRSCRKHCCNYTDATTLMLFLLAGTRARQLQTAQIGNSLLTSFGE